MKKGPNNEPSSRSSSETAAKEGRFTLPKSQILRGRKNFNRLFSDKATVFKSTNVSLRFYLCRNRETPDCKMAFIVPKRLGKAVRRNRVKRQVKEAYRLNQYIIIDEVVAAGCIFHGALTAKTINAEYKVIKLNIVDLLKRVKGFIKSSDL